jgi:hypothetical protein
MQERCDREESGRVVLGFIREGDFAEQLLGRVCGECEEECGVAVPYSPEVVRKNELQTRSTLHMALPSSLYCNTM